MRLHLAVAPIWSLNIKMPSPHPGPDLFIGKAWILRYAGELSKEQKPKLPVFLKMWSRNGTTSGPYSRRGEIVWAS